METTFCYQPEKLPGVVCDQYPQWKMMYNRAWQTAFENIEYPQKVGWKPQMTCMPGAGIVWQWDSCLMTFFSRFGHRVLGAMNNLDNLYRLQRPDGFMSMAYEIPTEKPAYGERINPPLFAWAEWEYFQFTGDDQRFEKVLPILVKSFEWIKKNRTRISGLYWFEDSGSSGMDNAPRSGYPSEKLNGSDICFIDLACQQVLTSQLIVKIARYLGQNSLAERFAEEDQSLRLLINEYHWNERSGFYFDLFGRSLKEERHNFLNHKTLAAMWTLISEIADDNQVRRLISHLTNPDEFWTVHPLASLSKDDPNYDPLGGYWLGGVWAPTNYMVAKGLVKHGRCDLAREIAVRHLDAIIAVADNKEYDSIWECYSPELMMPATNGYDKLARRNFVGWTGLGPIAMLIEHIFGFDFDALQNQITWSIQTPGRHGVENLAFNRKTLTMIADEEDPVKKNRTITIETTGEVKVVLSMATNKSEIIRTLPPGCHKISLQDSLSA